MSVIPPFFLNAVVALGDKTTDGVTHWNASGFLYGVPQPGREDDPLEQRPYHIWLVTNRHVILGMGNPVVRFDSNDGKPSIELQLPKFTSEDPLGWRLHPNPQVDVAVIQLSPETLTSVGAKVLFFAQDEHGATIDQLKKLEVYEGHAGFILGFPLGLVGPTNAVIVRQACIARIRDVYEGNVRTPLIDGSGFPGNSGGPVVLRPEMISIQGTRPLERAILIGIVTGYHTWTDVAVSRQTGRERVRFEEHSGLTVIEPLDSIIETIGLAPPPAKSTKADNEMVRE